MPPPKSRVPVPQKEFFVRYDVCLIKRFVPWLLGFRRNWIPDGSLLTFKKPSINLEYLIPSQQRMDCAAVYIHLELLYLLDYGFGSSICIYLLFDDMARRHWGTKRCRRKTGKQKVHKLILEWQIIILNVQYPSPSAEQCKLFYDYQHCRCTTTAPAANSLY